MAKKMNHNSNNSNRNEKLFDDNISNNKELVNELTNDNNIFQEIELNNSDKKKRNELYFEEVRKQYQNTLTNGTFNNNKDIDWILGIIRTLFQVKLTTKEEKKKFVQWLFKNLIVQVDSLRLKYKDQQQQQQHQKDQDQLQQQQQQRLLSKLWEYELQIIIRFEYLLLKEQLFEKKENSQDRKEKNINSIENLVSLLQDVSFLMDSITNNNSSNSSNNNSNNSSSISTSPQIVSQGFINFLETVILPRYIIQLKDTLIKIYKLLEISKPKQLKKDKSNKLDSTRVNELIIKDNPDIESALSIDLNKDDDIIINNKKKRKDNSNNSNDNNNITNNSNKTTSNSSSSSIPKDLFRNRNVKNLNHFTMALSNPLKSFRTITTTTTTSSSSSSSSSQQNK